MNLEERKLKFLEKAKVKFGDKYDYSKVDYIDSKSPIVIICPIHGEFEQTPSNHLRGKGCPKCGRKRDPNKLKEDFIRKANEIHHNKYDYSKVNYVNSQTKVEIICPEHGSFWQIPNQHILGRGCPICAGVKKSSTGEFIEKARKIHGNKYDYSKVKYVNCMAPVEIICPKHGSFWQVPNDHISHKCGCPKCYNEKGGRINLTLEEFQNELNDLGLNITVFGEYKGSKENIKCKCNICGCEWENTPKNIKEGSGCPECGKKRRLDKVRLSPELYKEKLNLISPNIELLTEYSSSRELVKCRCKTCGHTWNNIARNLLNGAQCPNCGMTFGESQIKNYLENHNIDYVYNKHIIEINEDFQNFMRIDFYIPSKNLFIEFNGKQHYIPIAHFGGEVTFKRQQKRDEYLRKYCGKNNINLLEIRYDENVNEKLDEYFSK